MIRAGKTPCLVLVQRKTEIAGTWNPTVVWVEVGQIWVSIQPERGREMFRGDELESVVSHKIRGDFLDFEDVKPDDRIVYNDTHDYGPHGIRVDSLVFDILALMPNVDGRDDILISANLNPRRYGDLPAGIPQ